MAHSNRQKLKDARGGMTRNQQRKAKSQSNSTSQSSRLSEITKWVSENEKRKTAVPVKGVSAEVKVVRYEKSKNAEARRRSALERLNAQLKTGMKPGKKPVSGIDITLDDSDIKRIKKEILILQNRI